MKKIKIVLGLLALSLIIAMTPKSDEIEVYASVNGSATTITTDTTINANITLGMNGVDGYVVESGATLTVSGVTISGSGSESVDDIFHVKNGGKLILDDVRFSNITANCGIRNEGVVDLTKAELWGNISTAIILNSQYDDTLEAHPLNVYSGYIPSVKIESGYMSVYENTTLLNTTRIITDVYDGQLVVKGCGPNVFANKLLDKFTLTTSDPEFFLDYVGDGCVATDGDVALSAGDIICTTYTLTAKDSELGTINYAGNNCTGNRFLTEYYDSYGYFPLFSCYNPNNMCMNNYYCNTSATVYRPSETAGAVCLKVNYQDVDGNQVFEPVEYCYPEGSNWAIFIDIPTGYKIERMNLDNNIVKLSNELYANNCYIRPIIEYVDTSYNNWPEVTLTVTYSALSTEASLSVTKENYVNLTHDEKLTIGDSHTFTIAKSENYKIIDIKFNDVIIEKEDLIDNGDSYSFTIEKLLENNTLVINSIELPYEIVVTPDLFEFEYGEDVVLIQEFTVEETGETITITFNSNENKNVGTYQITEGVSSSTDYIVTLAEGDYYYTINQKVVSINDAIIKDCELTYTQDLVITKDLFIDAELFPDYFSATLVSNDDLRVGEQEVQIRIDIVNGNYVLDNVSNNIVYATLKINPQSVDTSNYNLINLNSTYDGDAKLPTIENLDSNIVMPNFTFYKVGENDLKTEVQNMINAGQYLVRVTLSSKSPFYMLTNSELECVYNIEKASIDLSNYIASVRSTTIIYDGNKHYIDYKSSLLPNGVYVVSVDNNIGHCDANTYNIDINLGFDKENYVCEDVVDAELVILPKQVDVTLINSSFVYAGNAPQLQAIVDEGDIVNGDVVGVELSVVTGVNVGDYSVEIIGLTNPNYCTAQSVLSYSITKAQVDLGNVVFEDIEVVYDGQRHVPALSGTLPLGITHKIDSAPECTNVGVYNVKCSFTSSNNNYNAPNDIYAKVKITPKSIFLVFNEPENVFANGEKKTISVDFLEVVDGDDVDYTITYSGECILAGDYTCTINLGSNSNYKIVGANTYSFSIFNQTTTYVSDNINLTLEGKFKADHEVNVKDTSSNLDIVNVMAGRDFESYLSYKLNYQNYSNEPVQISIKSTGIFGSKNLSIYRVVNGVLEEIDYTINNGLITFEIQGVEELLFVDNGSDNLLMVLIIIGVSVVVLLTTTLVIVLKIKRGRNRVPTDKKDCK